MLKLFRNVQITVQISTQLILGGNVNDVTNTLNNLAYIFGDCPISCINQQNFAEAVKAIEAVKAVKINVQSRRRL